MQQHTALQNQTNDTFQVAVKVLAMLGIFMFQSSCCDLKGTSLFLSLEKFRKRFVTLHFLVVFSCFGSHQHICSGVQAPHSLYYKTSSHLGHCPVGSRGLSCIHYALDYTADDLPHQREVLDHESLLCCTGPLKITQGLLSAHMLYISIVWNWKTQ